MSGNSADLSLSRISLFLVKEEARKDGKKISEKRNDFLVDCFRSDVVMENDIESFLVDTITEAFF